MFFALHVKLTVPSFFCSPNEILTFFSRLYFNDSLLKLFVFLSCFLLCMKDDSIEGIYDTLKQCALISKSAGGIGLAVSCIRATGSYIAGVSVQVVPAAEQPSALGKCLHSSCQPSTALRGLSTAARPAP